MSLFSSFYTGVNGMNAQTEHTSSISNNIANATTVGYKKTDTVFSDLVITNTRPNKFAQGGVYTDTIRRVDRQGQLSQAGSTTEMGISGKGFFTVKSNDDDALPYLFTRNGTFSPDADGILRNAAGFVLYGWPIDQSGTVAAGTTLDSLVPVDVNELDNFHRQTTQAEFSVNLNAAEPAINPDLLVPQQTLPINSTAAPDFSRNFKIVDGDGVPRDLTFEFRKITGPMATAASGTTNLDYTMPLTGGLLSDINAGDTFTVTVGATSQEYIIGAPAGPGQVRIDTLGELSNEINTSFGGGNVLDMSLDQNGRIVFQAIDPAATMTFTNGIGTPLGTGVTSNTLALVTQSGNPALTYTPQDTSGYDQANFPAIANQTDPSTRGWWEVTILTADPADPTNPALPKVPISSGLMSFNSDGTLNAVPDANGDMNIALNNIDFDAGSTTDTTSMTIDVSRFSQFAGNYNVIIQNHNGAEAGTLTGIDVKRDGRVVASFSNSEQFEIYQVPLATFINPNGLEALTGTVFAQTEDAGDLALLAADSGGAGVIRSATIENSNVDLADEFAELIVSQRAFSANSKVVSTVDEMTQQLKQLKG